MAHILNIETATSVCSVSVFKEKKLLALEELDNGFTHAENLHLFIQKILAEAGLDIKDLDAVSVSKGPGSYTGLRIGASTAKGLAYALQIPLIGVDTLMIMSQAARQDQPAADYLCPMIDARRMEVYTAVYGQQLEIAESTKALIVDEESTRYLLQYKNIAFFGDGMDKCREVLSAIPAAAFIPGIKPSARNMGEIAYAKFVARQFENTAYFEPFYLKEFLAGKKKSVK